MQLFNDEKRSHGVLSISGLALMALIAVVAGSPAVAFEDADESVVIANEAEAAADAGGSAEESVGEPAEDAVVDGEPSAGEAPNPPPDDAAGDDVASPEALDGDAKAKD